MSNYQEDLGQMLRRARLIRGLSQKQVAQELYMNRATYTCYEQAKSLPSIVTLKKIAALFAIPIEYLLYPEKYHDQLPHTIHKRIRPLKEK